MLRATPLLKRVIPARRFATSWTAREAQQPKHPFSLKLDKTSFRDGFLQDPSVYPLIVILGVTLTFMTGMAGHALLTYKDVRIDPAKRGATLQYWGQEDTPSLTKQVTRRATRRMNLEEGLGVDHKEWLKQKKASE